MTQTLVPYSIILSNHEGRPKNHVYRHKLIAGAANRTDESCKLYGFSKLQSRYHINKKVSHFHDYDYESRHRSDIARALGNC